MSKQAELHYAGYVAGDDYHDGTPPSDLTGLDRLYWRLGWEDSIVGRLPYNYGRAPALWGCFEWQREYPGLFP